MSIGQGLKRTPAPSPTPTPEQSRDLVEAAGESTTTLSARACHPERKRIKATPLTMELYKQIVVRCTWRGISSLSRPAECAQLARRSCTGPDIAESWPVDGPASSYSNALHWVVGSPVPVYQGLLLCNRTKVGNPLRRDASNRDCFLPPFRDQSSEPSPCQSSLHN